ncbi:adenine methyltransferase [Methylovirgula sp. 4M-Z18]|nr:adenine methyltransferase [Methylovirgula sp. 4M-Z18]
MYADPPWQFHSWSHRGEDRGAVQHYGCMSLNDICNLPVRDIAAPDAALFIWVVQPMLPQALRVIEAWGFEFKTVAYCWLKIKGGQDRLFYDGADVRKGLGYHTRSGMEQCWLATRGKGYARVSQGEAQVVFSPLREHSRKPDVIAESIVNLTGDVPRLELFARTRRPGWDVWGNQVDKFGDAHEVVA